MTKLTLISDYRYTEQPKDYSYYVYYNLQNVVYTDTLDIDTREADKILDYIREHYNQMMYKSIENIKPLLMVEDAVEDDTLTEAVVLLKEVARKINLSAVQESELIEMVCGWAGQGSHQQDPSLPQGYQGRTVVGYPYTPSLLDSLQYYTLHDIRSTPYTTEMCGIRIALVTGTHNYDTCTYYDALGRLGCTAEEMTQAIRRASRAVYAEGQYSHAEGGNVVGVWHGIPLYEEEMVCSMSTSEDKPVRLAYEGKDTDTDTQQHSDTHIQQEDTAHANNTCTDSVIDTCTRTLTHNDVVYDTQEIDRYIHSMIDTH